MQGPRQNWNVHQLLQRLKNVDVLDGVSQNSAEDGGSNTDSGRGANELQLQLLQRRHWCSNDIQLGTVVEVPMNYNYNYCNDTGVTTTTATTLGTTTTTTTTTTLSLQRLHRGTAVEVRVSLTQWLQAARQNITAP